MWSIVTMRLSFTVMEGDMAPQTLDARTDGWTDGRWGYFIGCPMQCNLTKRPLYKFHVMSSSIRLLRTNKFLSTTNVYNVKYVKHGMTMWTTIWTRRCKTWQYQLNDLKNQFQIEFLSTTLDSLCWLQYHCYDTNHRWSSSCAFLLLSCSNTWQEETSACRFVWLLPL